MVRYLFYTTGDLAYQSPLVLQNLFHPNSRQKPVAVTTVYSVPDDGRKGRPKHVVLLTPNKEHKKSKIIYCYVRLKPKTISFSFRLIYVPAGLYFVLKYFSFTLTLHLA